MKNPKMRMRSTHFSSRQQARGATLVEILVTMLIVAFALLGIAGLQLGSVRYQQTSQFRTVAYNQAQNITERIRANTSALLETVDASAYRAANDYAAATTLPNDPGCGLGTGTCTAAESAQRDLREWRQMLAAELPGGRGALSPVTSGGLTAATSRTVTVMWMEKAQDSDDNLGAAPTDANCIEPRVAGVRCLNLVVNP